MTKTHLLFFSALALILFCCKKVSTANHDPVIPDPQPDPVIVSLDTSEKFQVMEGFGGFGARDVYWSNGPFTSNDFVNTLINDLGLTILRDNVPTDFEITNDNDDPFITDLSKYNLYAHTQGYDEPLGSHIQYLKDMKSAGLYKLITTAWSPPAWMKVNKRVNNGTNENSAPEYNANPSGNENQLRTDMYEEYAEMCVAYVKIIKQETGIDIYAFSIQNEPRFSQSYESCVFNGTALRDLLKVVGKRFRDEGLATKLFLPEDVGWLEGVQSMVKPSLDDPESRKYADIVAVHGYALDGITAASPDAQAWQTMYNWGAAYDKPLWMTETSGFSNDFNGALSLAKAMYTAIHFGNVSAWLFWSLSTSSLDAYCLMNTSGNKSKRYYVSKNFYKFIRPGMQRYAASAPENSAVLSLAFRDSAQNNTTIILINTDPEKPKSITFSGAGLPATFNSVVTTATEDCADKGEQSTSNPIIVPPNSVVTLYAQK